VVMLSKLTVVVEVAEGCEVAVPSSAEVESPPVYEEITAPRQSEEASQLIVKVAPSELYSEINL
jgi:hypothetical protein